MYNDNNRNYKVNVISEVKLCMLKFMVTYCMVINGYFRLSVLKQLESSLDWTEIHFQC